MMMTKMAIISAKNNEGQESVFDDSILLNPDCEDDYRFESDSDNIEEIFYVRKFHPLATQSLARSHTNITSKKW